MNSHTNTFIGTGAKSIHYYKWEKQNPKAILQIIHGMGEHAGRYAKHAENFTEEGYVVYANDHRGHGFTAESVDRIGYFDDGHFWHDTQSDIKQLTEIALSENPGLPIFILGHSMGSMLLRDYISTSKTKFAGAILSGTGGDPGVLGKIGRLLAKVIAGIYGGKERSEFLRSLSFGKFNKEFEPMRTKADWITRDNDEADKYAKDPMCSKTFTSGYWVDFLEGVLHINTKEVYNAAPKDLPMYIFSGGRDPVGDFGKGVNEVFQKYKQAGVTSIQCTIYEDARHEMLNEINRDEVIDSLLKWMGLNLPLVDNV